MLRGGGGVEGFPRGMNGGGGGGCQAPPNSWVCDQVASLTHRPYPNSGDDSKWFQLSILCTTLEIPHVSILSLHT